MATGHLDPAVKEADFLSLKVEDDDGDNFDDDYSSNSLAGLATISKRIGLVRDEVYQRCEEPKKGHGSQCSRPYSPPRRPDTEADLFAVGGMTRKHFASVVASCMAGDIGLFTRPQAFDTQFRKLAPKRSSVLTCVFNRKMFIGGLNWETTDGELVRTRVVNNMR